MLARLPRFDSSDPLNNTMKNYGYEKLFADKPAQKIITQPNLLKSFYDNALNNKMFLVDNFRAVFGKLEVYLAYDPNIKTAWFVSLPENKIYLANYFHEALIFNLKKLGIHLTGSPARLTPVGWQNLYDLLSEDFLGNHGPIKRVEIITIISDVRWRPPTLGLGVTFLNMKEFKEIQAAVEANFKRG